jgi:hypothetical protein
MMGLNPEQEQTLKYLRQQVDRLSEERFRNDARPTVNSEYHYARLELTRYTASLRKKGHNI